MARKHSKEYHAYGRNLAHGSLAMRYVLPVLWMTSVFK